jgi:hypothetical protein
VHRYLPALTAVRQREIGQEKLLSVGSQLIKSFIHGHLSYRFAGLGDGAQALPAGRAVRAGGLLAGRPCTSTRCEEAGAGIIRANDAAGALWGVPPPRP